ncbi:MAG TPA: Eco57I restriction-modification methylase domain-containing protein, partial [Gaiellaceae bacterium]|nr:Eco57I restriction-modification methylase domain-containing protein [Gaiellaceae bacterium]
LIEATRRILEAAAQEGLSPAETFAAVQEGIHGLDLNPLGILLTEAAIGLLVAPVLAEIKGSVRPLHLYITDSLARQPLGADTHGEEAEDIKARCGEYVAGFAYVIANPPYAKFPSRNFTPQQAARFAQTTHGHPNLYGLFLQVGVELLADGGRISYINPKSFVSGLYFKNLRRFLRSELDIERFDLFDKRTGLFDGVLQEVVILEGVKRASRVETIELRQFAGPPTCAPATVLHAAADSVLLGKSLDFLFFIEPDAAAHGALAAMLARGKPITEYGYRASTGTIVWNRVKPLIRDEAGDDRLPLIWGNGIREYSFVGAGNRQGKATHCKLAAKTRNIVSSGDAILVKRMTAKEEPRRIVACRVPPELADSKDGYFGENHINIVRAVRKDTSGVELDAVLGLLNSRLFDFVFRALNGNTQVSATELEMLPIATGPELSKIAKLARKLMAAGGKDAKTRAELDHLVYRLYGVRAETAAAIDKKTQLRASAA